MAPKNPPKSIRLTLQISILELGDIAAIGRSLGIGNPFVNRSEAVRYAIKETAARLQSSEGG